MDSIEHRVYETFQRLQTDWLLKCTPTHEVAVMVRGNPTMSEAHQTVGMIE